MYSRKTVIYATDSDLGFIKRLVEVISQNDESIIPFALGTSSLRDGDDYIKEQMGSLIQSIGWSDLVVLMTHGHSDCIYWWKFLGVRKPLIKSGENNEHLRTLFQDRDVILFSCFSNGRISSEIKGLWSKETLVFWDINTELVDYEDENESPMPITSRRHAIRHFQSIISHIFFCWFAELLNDGLMSMMIKMKQVTNRIIFQIYKGLLPDWVESDYEHLNPTSKDELRKLLLDFYRWFKII